MLLPNGNRCSKPAIYPANYKTAKSSMSVKWHVRYRFYSPQFPKGHPVKVTKNLNEYDSRPARKQAAEDLRNDVEASLLHGFNPIEKAIIAPFSWDGDVNPHTTVHDALTYALEKVRLEPATRKDVANVLGHFLKAAKYLKFDLLPMELVKRRIVRLTLDRVGETKGVKWTANNFNHHRKYLSLLFKELMELDVIDFNPVSGIAKQKAVKKHREVLTDAERKQVNDFLKEKHRRFWLFLNIFFHSGSRTTELLKIKGKDVELGNQYFKVTIIKGSSRREVAKVMKDKAVPFWTEVLQKCKPDQYVFSRLLKPGYDLVNAHQINRRWRTHVKLKLGIKADFYSLKHLSTDETSEKLGLNDAREHNSHTSDGTTLIYAFNEKKRRDARLKKSGSDFA